MFLRAGGSKKLKNDSLGTVLVIVLVCPRPTYKQDYTCTYYTNHVTSLYVFASFLQF